MSAFAAPEGWGTMVAAIGPTPRHSNEAAIPPPDQHTVLRRCSHSVAVPPHPKLKSELPIAAGEESEGEFAFDRQVPGEFRRKLGPIGRRSVRQAEVIVRRFLKTGGVPTHSFAKHASAQFLGSFERARARWIEMPGARRRHRFTEHFHDEIEG